MFAQRNKYLAVDNDDPAIIDQLEFEPMKKKFCSPSCIWTVLFTSLLISCYYIPSIGLTFYQRWLYQSFKFPLTTVLVHMTVKFILSALIRAVLDKRSNKPRILLGWREYLLAVGPTGVSSGIDIAFSNWGLELVTVSLYTMTKSTTIVFILIFSILFKLERKSWSLSGIVLMISLGLFLFTYKSTQFNILGFLLLLIASIVAGVRWTCVQLLLQKSKMDMKNPIDMIYHMQPLMIASVLPFAIWMEGMDVVRNCQLIRSKDSTIFTVLILKVLLGAFIAFFMEFSEVTLVTYTSSLTLAIAGIFKEVFILALAVNINGDVMSPINVVGLLVCLCGITFHVIHKLKTTPTRLKMGRAYEYTQERSELGEYLINDTLADAISESDGEKSDSQILFDILNRHDR